MRLKVIVFTFSAIFSSAVMGLSIYQLITKASSPEMYISLVSSIPSLWMSSLYQITFTSKKREDVSPV